MVVRLKLSGAGRECGAEVTSRNLGILERSISLCLLIKRLLLQALTTMYGKTLIRLKLL